MEDMCRTSLLNDKKEVEMNNCWLNDMAIEKKVLPYRQGTKKTDVGEEHNFKGLILNDPLGPTFSTSPNKEEMDVEGDKGDKLAKTTLAQSHRASRPDEHDALHSALDGHSTRDVKHSNKEILELHSHIEKSNIHIPDFPYRPSSLKVFNILQYHFNS